MTILGRSAEAFALPVKIFALPVLLLVITVGAITLVATTTALITLVRGAGTSPHAMTCRPWRSR